MNIVLLRVGIDTGCGGIGSPIFKDGSLVFFTEIVFVENDIFEYISEKPFSLKSSPLSIQQAPLYKGDKS